MLFYPIGTLAFSICGRGTQHARSGGCGISGPVFGFLAPGCGALGSGHSPGAAGEPSRAAGLEPLTLLSASPWAAGWGPPALFQPPMGLSHVWESPHLSPWKQDLALLCLTAESLLASLPFGCPALRGQSAFPTGIHFCLPFALCSVFLGTDICDLTRCFGHRATVVPTVAGILGSQGPGSC